MHFLQPTTWDEALEARAGLPDALPVAGGTDVGDRRRGCRREPADRSARLAGPDRHEERLRAGGMRLLLGLPGRRAGVLVPGAGRAGEDAEVVTVEGLAARGELDPVQEAFAQAGAIQCGFCTLGLVMTVHDLLRRVPDPSDGQIRVELSGNLCRCTGYQKIISAVRLAAGRTNGHHGY